MAIPVSGPISLANIQTEFGGSNPISLSEYYRGGGYVSDNNTSIPTSGALSIDDFYGASALATMYLQTLTGSGTFTPLYPNAKAIINFSSGAGGGSKSGNYGSTLIPGNGGSGGYAGFYVDNITTTYGGASYSVAAAKSNTIQFGYQGAFNFNGQSGNATYIGGAQVSGGGYGISNINGVQTHGAKGTPSGFSTSTTGMPAQVIYNGNVTSTAGYIYISAGGTGGGESGVYYPCCATYFPNNATPGGGSLNIYYIVE